MNIGQNSYCPCGSGKRFKKCCGALAACRDSDNIIINKAVAFNGAVGKQRKAFCERYTGYKQYDISRLVGEIRNEIEAKGESVTCGRGCSHCCKLYVFATLQEAEAIVYYLYHHPETLQQFLSSYTEWEETIAPIADNIERLENIEEKVLIGTETDEERQNFYDDLTTYASLLAPCPFLRDDACTIYSVRPYSCACLLSTSPREWCDRTNPARQKTSIYRKHPSRMSEMPYLGLTNSIIFGCLPQLVYRILAEGYAFLSGYPGLEGLKREAAADPEVRAVLRRFKVI